MTPELYSATINRLAEAARANMTNLGNQIDLDATGAASQLSNVYTQLSSLHADAASAMAADLYDALRLDVAAPGAYTATMAPAPLKIDRRQLEQLLNQAAQNLVLEYLAKAASQSVRTSAHETMAENIVRDPSKPRYSVRLFCDLRACHKKNDPNWWCDNVAIEVEDLPIGAKPDHWFHPNCPCIVVPNWSDGKSRRGGTVDGKVVWTDEGKTSGAGGGDKNPPGDGSIGGMDGSKDFGEYFAKDGSTVVIHEVFDAAHFRDHVAKLRDVTPGGYTIELPSVESLAGKRLFVSADLASAFVVASNGNVESVISSVKGRGGALARAATDAGGDRLDAYAVLNSRGESKLPTIYGEAGFKEVARVEINPNFDLTNGQAHHVSVMALMDINPRYLEFGSTQYESALIYRDRLLEK